MNLADFRPRIGQELNMSDKKAVIKNADMSEEMQQVKKIYWVFQMTGILSDHNLTSLP